jgi:hypothetical protein
MTIASEPITSESESAMTEEQITEQTPTIQDTQEDKALPLQDTISTGMASSWDSIFLLL